MCVNLCKTPVQQFFTEELGMPLTMCAPDPHRLRAHYAGR